MTLEIKRLHLASVRGVLVRGGPGVFDLLIGDAAYTPRQYAEPVSDCAPDGCISVTTPKSCTADPRGLMHLSSPAGTYTFTDITEELALVVVFAPRYGSRGPG